MWGRNNEHMKLIPGNWKLHRIYEYFYVRCISVSWLTTSWFCMSILDSFPWFFFKKMFVVKNLDILENFESFPPMALNKMTFSLTYWRLGIEMAFVILLKMGLMSLTGQCLLSEGINFILIPLQLKDRLASCLYRTQVKCFLKA